MSKPKTILSRKLRVCFDVDVKLLPLSAERLAEAPELAALQQALVENPALCNRTLVYTAVDELIEYIEELADRNGWMHGDPYADCLDAWRAVPLQRLRRFLFEDLLHQTGFEYVGQIFDDPYMQGRRRSKAIVIDRETGQELDWSTVPTPLFRQTDTERRFLLVESQGEMVLCLNLSHASGVEAVLEYAAGEVRLPVGSLLGCVEGELSPERHDELLVRLAEAFPGLPVEIFAGPQDYSWAFPPAGRP